MYTFYICNSDVTFHKLQATSDKHVTFVVGKVFQALYDARSCWNRNLNSQKYVSPTNMLNQ